MTVEAVDAQRMERARALMAARRRIEAELYEAVSELDAAATASAAGYTALPILLSDLWRVDRREARSWCAQSATVTEVVVLSGERLGARYPHTAAALAEGAVGREHVAVIDRTMRVVDALPDVAPDAAAVAEKILAAAARSLSPEGLERVARRLLAQLDPDGAAPDEKDPPDKVLRVRRRRQGGVSFDGAFAGTLDAERFLLVLETLAQPAGPDDRRSVEERRADALLELCDEALSPTGLATDATSGAPAADPETEEEGAGEGTDAAVPEPGDEPADLFGDPVAPAPRRPGGVTGRAQLFVTMTLDDLRAGHGYALLDGERPISPTDARRLACDAGVVPVVLGSQGEPLDVGRIRYTVPAGMRRALHVRDQGCTWPGCDRRPRRCHAHHVREWTGGGVTALDNLTLLCRVHHDAVHRSGWQIVMRGGRPWFVPPAHIDPDRRPRPGGPYPLAAG